MPELIAAAEAARLVRRIEALAQKRLAALAPQDAPTFECADCLDIGWILVPCRNPNWKCVECIVRHDHEVARACLSCEPGVQREAGIWFRFLYARDRRGKPALIEHRTAQYERAMLQMGGAAKRVQLALDAIIEREKGGK